VRSQLLEKQNWGDYGDLPCGGDSPTTPWSIPLDDEAKLPACSLVRFIEVDVVPGLVQAHRSLTPAEEAPPSLASATIEEFAALVLAEEGPVLSDYVERLHEGGTSFQALYLGLLSATARRLGEFWEADIVDFTSVTIGLWRLQELLRKFSPIFQAEGAKPINGHRALLLSTPGEQHNFGLAMLGEFLFRDGWSIAGGPGLRADEISSLVKNQFFSVVGLTLSSERGIESLTSTIRMIRKASRNRSIVVMVGGALFIERPELVALVGADSTAADAQQGAIQAERLINNLGSGR
jgi:methanogenic corrinoid protein MtbC1